MDPILPWPLLMMAFILSAAGIITNTYTLKKCTDCFDSDQGLFHLVQVDTGLFLISSVLALLAYALLAVDFRSEPICLLVRVSMFPAYFHSISIGLLISLIRYKTIQGSAQNYPPPINARIKLASGLSLASESSWAYFGILYSSFLLLDEPWSAFLEV